MVAKVRTTKKSTKTVETKTTEKRAAPPQKEKQEITEADIAEHAYMLWLERGGSEMDNWLEAERQLK